MNNTGVRLGVDMGGTKTEIVALADDGRELLRRRIPSPRGNYTATIDMVTGLVREAEAELGMQGSVGIAIPGSVSPATGLIQNANSVWLIGKPLARDLAAALDRPVRLANDANCFALSEATDGAAAGANSVFGVILGTGCGAGIVIGGQAIEGANAIAGEWGHNPLPWPERDETPGPSCYCGKSGCIETFLSGPAIARDHRQRGGSGDAGAIAKAARNGDRLAARTMARYVDRLARALASMVNVLDPDVIVLGGGVSNIDMVYVEVPKFWQPYAFSEQIVTPLVKAKHGDSSGVRGAAWLWPANSPS